MYTYGMINSLLMRPMWAKYFKDSFLLHAIRFHKYK